MNTNAKQSILEQTRTVFLRREGNPVFFADWKHVLFVHFSAPQDLLQPSVPFPIDCREGNAFVSLVAFTFSNMCIRGLGNIGALVLKPFLESRFLNVRTYVRGPEGPGIFFLREYLSNPLSVPLGLPSFGLPYRHGNLCYKASPEADRFTARVSAADFRIEMDARRNNDGWQTCNPRSLDAFLLERYVAYTIRRNRPCFFRIFHAPWPQAKCQIECTRPLPDCLGAWTQSAQLLAAHLSPGVDRVWLGRPHRIV